MIYRGYDIYVCAPGTVIRNTDGQELTVTETNAVVQGPRMYVTATQNAKLIDAALNAPIPTEGGQNAN